MTNRTKIGKAVYGITLATVLMAVLVFAATPTQTYLSDSTSYFKGLVGINTDTPSAELDVAGDGVFSGTVDVATLNTGQGDNELYDMNQNVLTTSDVQFATGEFINSGNGNGLLIDQNGNGKGLLIDSEATSQQALRIEGNGNSASSLYIAEAGATGSGINAIASFNQFTSGTGDVLGIRNDGTGNGLFIEQNGSARGIFVDNQGTAEAIFADQDGLLAAGKSAVYFLNDLVDQTTGAAMVSITDAKSGSTIPTVSIRNDGTGDAIEIDQNGDGLALSIDSEATTGSNAAISVAGIGNTIAIGRPSSSINGNNWFYRNQASADTAGPVMFIEQDNVGDDQNALTIQQDGTGAGLLIDQNGANTALDIDGGSCAAGQYGLYESAGDLYWCKNGASTKLN